MILNFYYLYKLDNMKNNSLADFELMKDYFDINDLDDNLDFYRDLMNLREFEVIFKHEKIIEKELLLFLSEDLPEYIPFFYYIPWESLKPYKADINNCKLIDLEKLDVTPKTRKDINSIFINESKSKTNNSQKSNKNNKIYFTDNSINSQKSKNNSSSKNTDNISQSKESNLLEQSTILNDDDFKLKDTIETIKYEPYIVDNNISGTLFESDISNYIYDIFYILSSGKVNMMRNKKYNYENDVYELDFQIVNLKLKYFLYFMALLYPNISNLDTIDLNLAILFKGGDNILEKIDNLKIEEKLKEYEYLDILGEITVDYLNISGKKEKQFQKYQKLIKKLQEKPVDNKLFNFIDKNKKIIIIITNGKYEQFYKNFKIKTQINENINNRDSINNKNEIKVEKGKASNNNIIINENNNNEINFEKGTPNNNITKNENNNNEIIPNKNITKNDNNNNEINVEKDKRNNTMIINDNTKKNILNYLFIYVNKKTDECNILKQKIIFCYINFLEKKLEELTNNNNEEVINKFKCLKLSEINNNFYKKINASRKIQSFRACLKNINKDYINKLPSLFSKYINHNITIDNYEQKLKEIFKIEFKNKEEISKRLKEQYEKEKDNFSLYVSIYEISDSGLFFEKYENDKIKIINYKKQEINK